MQTCKWYLPTLAEVMHIAESPYVRQRPAETGSSASPHRATISRAQCEWYSAITSLNVLLDRLLDTAPPIASEDSLSPVEGVVISGPLPVLGRVGLIQRFSSWVLTGGIGQPHVPNPFQLLPAADIAASAELSTVSLPLLPDDPLGAEPFCLVLTPEFSLMVSLHVTVDDGGRPIPQSEQFLFSFTPEVVWQGWRSLRSRLELTTPHIINNLDSLIEQFAPVTPDYRLVADFNRLMLAHFADLMAEQPPTGRRRSAVVTQATPSPGFRHRKEIQSDETSAANSVHPVSSVSRSGNAHSRPEESIVDTPFAGEGSSVSMPSSSQLGDERFDAELLQAIAHEVRTPLATIRTLTRLLLKKKNLPDAVLRQLTMIDAECTRQIDRFGLIFRAAEIQEQPESHIPKALARISLSQLLQQNNAQWQKQAEQRNLKLTVLSPKPLPMVLSDPIMLEQVLSGLVDQLTHALPAGSHIEICATPAGSQIKLQVFSTVPDYTQTVSHADQNGSDLSGTKAESIFSSTLKSIGQLLMFQPETGNLSLNLDVTKNLFHVLGGKFTIRQHPHQGEVLTIFLPRDESNL